MLISYFLNNQNCRTSWYINYENDKAAPNQSIYMPISTTINFAVPLVNPVWILYDVSKYITDEFRL